MAWASSADELEEMLAGVRDWAVARGGGVARPMAYHRDERVHLFNGAVLAGNGVQVELFHSIEREDQRTWRNWSPSRRQRMARLMNAIQDNPAQAPGGARERVPAGAALRGQAHVDRWQSCGAQRLQLQESARHGDLGSARHGHLAAADAA